ncbi:MAG: PVC-type heme-binding CxxCH protein [Planctomycetota bacterium]|nr:PVC-type heme-binding CxxCH protein [Planctomycetota bacterium]
MQKLILLTLLLFAWTWNVSADAQNRKQGDKTKSKQKRVNGRNTRTGKPDPPEDAEYQQYGIYANKAPRAPQAPAAVTRLPLQLKKGQRIALVGNTLLDRARHFGYFETLLHQRYPAHQLIIRNLSWSADTTDIQPRPANFADLEQHLAHEKIDVVIAAFGFNESFAGEKGLKDFREKLKRFVQATKTRAFNGKTSPQVVFLSPVANEDISGVDAGKLNNARIKLYAEALRAVAAEQNVGFVDVFTDTLAAMESENSQLTFNGCHLTDSGYQLFANSLYRELFGEKAPPVNQEIRQVVVDKNRQFFRRYRPLNTFYYTGGRNKSYGYLDFLPAMKNFDILVSNREQRIWAMANGQPVPDLIDDSNLPELPKTKESRGANRWISAEEELKEFRVDPRFEVNLFAGEEEFPDIAAPIQMRWDSQGRLWVSCSTTYPHVYPGNEPNDKLVILEDTDGDGKADKSTVFADNLHIPLSFEFGDGGVYVSEMPDLTFLKDTDGDGKADVRKRVWTGFGTEDSHHSLHDFTWTPDGDLIFRESIFHHSQVETPYGPVRQQNSGWFRYEPRSHRLTSFGTYHSTNPWGVTFDDWGQHMASHPIYAEAFHSLDPPFPNQHPRPAGLQAYSGVCGQEFIDFKSFPPELMYDHFVKVRYKPTNRVEILRWKETEYGFQEEYVSDLIFSSNLSFIPVDLRYGPRGAMYVCDWYNPVKGHAQYSLRDERRDRHSGRIWRIVAKDRPLVEPPRIAGASIEELLEILKRREYRYRYWAKREIREKDPEKVRRALDLWVNQLDPNDPRYRHHQLEAVWTYRNVNRQNTGLLRELLACENHLARAAATKQLRYWYPHMSDAISLLNRSANDRSSIVRMQAAIAASYLGTREAMEAILDIFKKPTKGHLAYALTCALGSKTLQPYWKDNPEYDIQKKLQEAKRKLVIREPNPSASQTEFDRKKNLKTVKISCVPERMLFTVSRFDVRPGQPVKVVFTNPDATDHNLVFVRKGALEEVGMAANDMARDPKNANSDFIPRQKKHLILEASPMIGPTKKSLVAVLRFTAPSEPGIYPYVCTFPGHWVIMKGNMVVARDRKQAQALVEAAVPREISQWKFADFSGVKDFKQDEAGLMRGMQAFVKARCNQCHAVAGHGINLGPDLSDVAKRFRGQELLRQIIEPSAQIHEKFKTTKFLLHSGKVTSGMVVGEDKKEFQVVENFLTPNRLTRIRKRDVEQKVFSRISTMPEGLLNVLTREEVLNLVGFLEAGGHKMHGHPKKSSGKKD